MTSMVAANGEFIADDTNGVTKVVVRNEIPGHNEDETALSDATGTIHGLSPDLI